MRHLESTSFRLLPAAALLLALMFGSVHPARATAFAYHDYDGMVAELQAFAATYPGLAEHFTAQDAYGLPTVPDGALDLEQHILRITNESLGLDKPEVLMVGVQHGDEIVSLEVCLELARLLLESYGTDPWLTELVDRREIYMIPLANPHGFNHGVRSSPGDEGSEDMNRDHIYDRCTGFCAFDDEDSLSTVGARAIHELARRHLFRVMLDYHGGIEIIIYPWGTPLHTANTESPDEAGADALGLRMQSFGGPYNGLSPVGTSNDLLGAVHGPMDDTAYASSWDVANADPLWPTDGWRAVAYTIEISNQKMPPVATLGGDADLLTPGGLEDGYVPKNVRVGLAAIDIVEPYILWTNRASIPAQVGEGEPFTVEWEVRGCFEVDDTHVRWGTDPDPLTTFSGQTTSQQQTTGTPCFETPTLFSAEVSIPTAGTYYLTPAAQVDSSLLDQGNPTPNLLPQSWLVRSRTEDGLLETNSVDPTEVNNVRGQMFWGVEALEIQVGEGSLIFADGFESGNTSAWN
ncbi:MAG: zinc carboxypeptidase [bacterium]|nr:zinc carboxypeptidase [bacterium]